MFTMSLLAVLLLCATAYALPPRSDLRPGDYPRYLESSYDDSGKRFGRNLDSIGGGNLLRDLESGLLRSRGYLAPRASRQLLDSLTGNVFGNSKRSVERWGTRNGNEVDNVALEKKNFDEIDRSGFDGFVKRQRRGGFDEIDRAGWDGFVKRQAGRGGFDEIDRAGWDGFVKRQAGKGEKDEKDRAGAGRNGGYGKRYEENGGFDEIDRAGWDGFGKKHGFDEFNN